MLTYLHYDRCWTSSLIQFTCFIQSPLVRRWYRSLAYKLLSIPLMTGWLQTFCVLTVQRLNFSCRVLRLSYRKSTMLQLFSLCPYDLCSQPRFHFYSHLSSVMRSILSLVGLYVSITFAIFVASALFLTLIRLVISTSFVYSRLDICISMYYCLPKSQLNRLQCIQNALVRAVVVAAPRSSNPDHILRSLHWL